MDEYIGLRRMGVGIVAENKVLGETSIQCLPVEALNLMGGELNSQQVEMKRAGIDVEEIPYLVTINKKATIAADWLQCTNRVTAPDVRRGEQVFLYRVGDTDQYLWRSMGRDDDLRRLETLLWRFSAFADNNNDPLTSDNSYTLELSTHAGHLVLTTTDVNGEHCKYTIKLDTKAGQLLIADDIGNSVTLDSASTLIQFINAAGTTLELNQGDLNVIASGNINLTAAAINMIKG